MGWVVEIRSDEESGWRAIGKEWVSEEDAQKFFDILLGMWINSIDEREIDKKEEDFYRNTRIIKER